MLILGRIYERENKAVTGFEDRDLSGAQNEHRQKLPKIAAELGAGQATVRRERIDKAPVSGDCRG